MTWQTLRAERYLRPESTELAKYILNELPYLDYPGVREFYDKITAQNLPPKDYALLGMNDRYFLLTGLMNRRDAFHPWLYDRCREVEKDPDGYLDLWARAHYKSTIITFAGVIQEAIGNPELTIGILSYSKETARAFLQQIKTELETNEKFQVCYPDVLWERVKDAPTWSLEKGLVFRRRSNPKEATIEAHGLIEGMPTGRHFQMLVYDDVITERAVTNPDQIKKATESWEMSDNLGPSVGMARKWTIGTRYHFGDTYGVAMERGVLIPRLYPATHNGEIEGDPVFLDRDTWEKKKIAQRSQIASQMLQNPLAGSENMFNPSWFRPYEVRPAIMNVFIMGDPAASKSKSSDRTAIAVIGVDSRGNKFLLDGFRHRMSLSERWANLRDLYRKWIDAPGVHMVKVGWEKYGAQADIEHFEERMRLEGEAFTIYELNWTRDGDQSKKHRVGRLEPDMRLSRFFMPAIIWHADFAEDCYWKFDDIEKKTSFRKVMGQTRVMQAAAATNQGYRCCKAIKRLDEDGRPYDLTRALQEEMAFFPFSPRDDLVDAVSRIYDIAYTMPEPNEMLDMKVYRDE